MPTRKTVIVEHSKDEIVTSNNKIKQEEEEDASQQKKGGRQPDQQRKEQPNASISAKSREEMTSYIYKDQQHTKVLIDGKIITQGPSDYYKNIAEGNRRTRNNVGIKAQFLPMKLAAILSEPEYSHIITWMPHGRAWKLLRPEEFMTDIAPQFFDRPNYSSFIRLINGWGFRRILQGRDAEAYFHEVSKSKMAIKLISLPFISTFSPLTAILLSLCCLVVVILKYKFFLKDMPHLHMSMRRLSKTNRKLYMHPLHEPNFYEMAPLAPSILNEGAVTPSAAPFLSSSRQLAAHQESGLVLNGSMVTKLATGDIGNDAPSNTVSNVNQQSPHEPSDMSSFSQQPEGSGDFYNMMASPSDSSRIKNGDSSPATTAILPNECQFQGQSPNVSLLQQRIQYVGNHNATIQPGVVNLQQQVISSPKLATCVGSTTAMPLTTAAILPATWNGILASPATLLLSNPSPGNVATLTSAIGAPPVHAVPFTQILFPQEPLTFIQYTNQPQHIFTSATTSQHLTQIYQPQRLVLAQPVEPPQSVECKETGQQQKLTLKPLKVQSQLMQPKEECH